MQRTGGESRRAIPSPAPRTTETKQIRRRGCPAAVLRDLSQPRLSNTSTHHRGRRFSLLDSLLPQPSAPNAVGVLRFGAPRGYFSCLLATPSRFIRYAKVVGLRSSAAAAPSSP